MPVDYLFGGQNEFAVFNLKEGYYWLDVYVGEPASDTNKLISCPLPNTPRPSEDTVAWWHTHPGGTSDASGPDKNIAGDNLTGNRPAYIRGSSPGKSGSTDIVLVSINYYQYQMLLIIK